MLNKLYEALLMLLFPPKCPICHTIIDKHPAFCISCLTAFAKSAELDPRLEGLKHLGSCYVMCEYKAGLKRLCVLKTLNI